jgi:hypothetical protein
MNMREQDIVLTALENLQRIAHIKGKWEGNAHNLGIDGLITLRVDNQEYKFFAEVKSAVRNYQLMQVEKIANDHKPFLLIAEHIFPRIKEELRLKNIGYLETNGNIYVKEPGLHLWMDNQKPLNTGKTQTNKAFTKTGLKIIFHIIVNNDIVNHPYREISKMLGVGLGNVNNVINGLKEEGFILKLNKNEFKLNNRKNLLEKWLVSYQEKLKPTLHIGTFRFLNGEDFNQWKNLTLTPRKTFWGGEPAGDVLTQYLRPEILTIYTEESRNELIKNYRLVPDEKGKVEVYKKFWNDEAIQNNNEIRLNSVPPVLAYADLMNTGDGRCIETAQKIMDGLLRNEF